MAKPTVAEWVEDNVSDVRISGITTFGNINYPEDWKEIVIQELERYFAISVNLGTIIREVPIRTGTKACRIMGWLGQRGFTWRSTVYVTPRWIRRIDTYLPDLRKTPDKWGTPRQTARMIDLDMFLTLIHEVYHSLDQDDHFGGFRLWIKRYARRWRPWHIWNGRAHPMESGAYVFENKLRKEIQLRIFYS